MITEQIIRRLRARCPVFAHRVAGAADASQWDASRATDLPFAVVIPLGTRPTVGETGAGRNNKAPATIHIEHGYQVQVIISGAGDERNQLAAQQWETLRMAILDALLWWRPTKEQGEITFRSVEVGEQSREYSLWLVNVGVPETWTRCAGEVDLTYEDLEALGAGPPFPVPPLPGKGGRKPKTPAKLFPALVDLGRGGTQFDVSPCVCGCSDPEGCTCPTPS